MKYSKDQIREALSEATYKVKKEELGNSAEKVYKSRRKEANDKIKRISAALKKMDAKAKKDPSSWGHAGNMGNVIESLDEILQFIGG